MKIHEGNAYHGPLGNRWQKDCDCAGTTATTGETWMAVRPGPTPETVVIDASLIPGPSCDSCGKAWRECYAVDGVSFTGPDGKRHVLGNGTLYIERVR